MDSGSLVAPSDPDDVRPVVLAGGVANPGEVYRVGDTVRRPQRPFSPGVHAFLNHLRERGVRGTPVPLGHDPQGREVLSWVAGDTTWEPYAPWVADDDVLAGVAAFQRGLHRAAEGFEWPDGVPTGAPYLPPSASGTLVCHNDLCVENIVMSDGRVAGCIDFDYAAPTDPLVDIAIAARHWVPLRDPADLDPAREGVDPLRRFGLFCDIHRLSRDDRRRVVGLAGEFLDAALASVRELAAAGTGGFPNLWAGGYEQANRRARSWLTDRAEALADR